MSKQKKISERLADLEAIITDVKVIKVVIGKNKKPLDKPGEIILHIDF